MPKLPQHLASNPNTGDYIQVPVDEAYARGINAMGQAGPQADISEYLDALGHLILAGMMLRGGIGENPIAKMIANMLRRGETYQPGRQPGAAATLEDLQRLRSRYLPEGSPSPLRQPAEFKRGGGNVEPLKLEESAKLYEYLLSQTNPVRRFPQ